MIDSDAQRNVNKEIESFQAEIKALAEKYDVGFFYSAFKPKEESLPGENQENPTVINVGGTSLSANDEEASEALLRCFGTAVDCMYDFAYKNEYNIALFHAKFVEGVSKMNVQMITSNLEKIRIAREKYGPFGALFAQLGLDIDQL